MSSRAADLAIVAPARQGERTDVTSGHHVPKSTGDTKREKRLRAIAERAPEGALDAMLRARGRQWFERRDRERRRRDGRPRPSKQLELGV